MIKMLILNTENKKVTGTLKASSVYGKDGTMTTNEIINGLQSIETKYADVRKNDVQFEALESAKEIVERDRWVPCNDRLPENAYHKGRLCERCLITTKYGVTEGWYNPDHECWYALIWFKYGYFDEQDIHFTDGDKPKVVRLIDGMVVAWRPLPEQWKGET